MKSTSCTLVGIPTQSGTNMRGCMMGPAAFRTAGLAEALTDLGHTITDAGDIIPDAVPEMSHANPALHHLGDVVAWTRAIEEAAFTAASKGEVPIFLGGDHVLAAGSVSGVARAAQAAGKPLFVLWLDAHPDFHDLASTTSGNLHGTPVAYFTGQPGFEGAFPPPAAPVPISQVCMMGIRSVDPAERARLESLGATVHDMRAIDENGIAPLLAPFLEEVEAAGGWLHVSFDVDFLDPGIAPAVGTTVPGGATFREAHLIMEMVHDSGLLTSLDLVELNPFLDERGRTAHLMVDFTASLMGRRILDRRTRSAA